MKNDAISISGKMHSLAKMVGVVIAVYSLLGCTNTSTQPLPILGHTVVENGDTIFSSIADFRFMDQDSNIVTNATFDGRIYIADFIFLSCPTICPKLTSTIQAVYKEFRNDDRVVFLSHTIDPERDSISRLKEYANNLEVPAKKWHFVTGNKDSIFQLANKSYFSIAYPDRSSPGGFTHSGAVLLVDAKRHIRGVYNGLRQEVTTRLIDNIKTLLKEQN